MPTRKQMLVVALTPIVALGVAAQPAAAHPHRPQPIVTYDGDPGRPVDPASWRTPEFVSDTGLVSMGAEFAYAAGYAGAGENIGLVDSGFFNGHPVEQQNRYFSVVAEGGQTGPTPGYYDPAFNDTHGTHVSGTVGAARDGVGQEQPQGTAANMHGVAFNANVYMGNTHKTDAVLYGQLPPGATAEQTPDNAYLANVYRAVNRARTTNGKRIRIVSSSWGSAPAIESYNTYEGLLAAWRNLALPEGVPDSNGTTSHWINGPFDVARTGTIIGFSAGNGGVANPTPRGAATYFKPELEGSWFTTSGTNDNVGRTFNPDGSVLVPGQQRFNQCGVAKWACVTAPSTLINSTTVELVDGVPQPRYARFSGTSMAAPHSAGALALIMQRFPYLTNEQALYTMYTTGRQNSTTNDAAGVQIPNPTAGQIVQVPDARNGWGTPSLREALNGPGQLFGAFDVNTRSAGDVWSNDISDVAIRARELEDDAEAAAWQATKQAKGWTSGLPADATDADRADYAIGTAREKARKIRVYAGSLTKRGGGTLFLTGDDTWTGKTTVLGGKLSVAGTHASAVRVRGGVLGGTGTVAGDVEVTGGELRPGVAAGESATVPAGTTLSAGGGVRLGGASRYAVTIKGTSDYTRVRANGALELDGRLSLDVRGPLTRGAVLTILSGSSVRGTFDGLPEGKLLASGGHLLRVSYRSHSVTLTVIR
ncbi:S8 family serine peptidase [Actinoplanes sp. NPDC051513]|uniref:S8 family serine peptidase n=1 Tax=Actinoplanes sp. NPDC051513 TaxID=3363908 RepID=UPI0037B37D05